MQGFQGRGSCRTEKWWQAGDGAEAKVETDSWSVGSYSSQAWGPMRRLICTSLCWSSTVEYFSIPVGSVHSRRNKLVVSSVILRRHFDTVSSRVIATLAALRRRVVFTVLPWLWLFRSVDTAYLPVSFGLNVGYSCHESFLSRLVFHFTCLSFSEGWSFTLLALVKPA